MTGKTIARGVGLGALLWISGLSVPPAVAVSEEERDAWVQQTMDAGNRTIRFLLDKFRPHVTEENRDLLTQERIKVVYAADFNAYTDYQKRRILIPIQFTIECMIQIEGFMMMNARPALRPKYLKWLQHLSERTYAARLEALRGAVVDEIPITPFWEYAKQPMPGPYTGRDLALRDGLMDDALGLVLAHELGHLILKHKQANLITAEQSQRQEYAADKFGANLMKKADISVIPGLATFFLRFAQLEALEKGIDPDKRTHPPSMCRFYHIINVEMPILRNLTNKQRRDFERGSGGMTVAQLDEVIEGLQEECEG